MPKCNNCRKSGLFLKTEAVTGLCPDCHTRFTKAGKPLTEKIMRSKNAATGSNDPAVIIQNCIDIERLGNELVQLHRQFKVEPGRELLELIDTYTAKGALAQKHAD